jgi:POT family proton-dependent oligopeptide transporter
VTAEPLFDDRLFVAFPTDDEHTPPSAIPASAIDETRLGLGVGLALISIGSGGIKPCVSAHVGDQFGPSNESLLPRVFSWFYFAINLGAFVSSLLTPWLLDRHGPGWAFGVPGIFMAAATVIFWMGRH